MMNDINHTQERDSGCAGRSRSFGQKLMFLVLGGGIGAALALLLTPKSGKELRTDISELAVKGYDETLNAAHRLKEQTREYYATAKEAGTEVLDIVATGASAVSEEVRSDARKIGKIVGNIGDKRSDGLGSEYVL